jgi:hypothetical protein
MSSSGAPQGFPQITAPIAGQNGQISTIWYRLFITWWNQLQTALGQNAIPSGMVSALAAPNVPLGWFICDGSAVSRSTFSSLFAAIGTTWGAGDGSTTFNLPDLKNRFLVGDGTLSLGNMAGNVPISGGSGNGYGVILWIIKV